MCWRCGKVGHKTGECMARLQEVEGGKEQEGGEARVGTAFEEWVVCSEHIAASACAATNVPATDHMASPGAASSASAHNMTHGRIIIVSYRII